MNSPCFICFFPTFCIFYKNQPFCLILRFIAQSLSFLRHHSTLRLFFQVLEQKLTLRYQWIFYLFCFVFQELSLRESLFLMFNPIYRRYFYVFWFFFTYSFLLYLVCVVHALILPFWLGSIHLIVHHLFPYLSLS